MALWFPIMVNEFSVGRVVLVRTAPVDHMPFQNEECTYRLEYFKDTYANAADYTSTIKHPYLAYDPIPLLAAALKQIKEDRLG